MGERGFLQYTREVYIHTDRAAFTPDILTPHLDHFRSFDQVHSLTIEFYDSDLWLNHHISSPLNHYRCVLQFALQFPHLDSLCIDHLENEYLIQPDLMIPNIVDNSPLLRGHLRVMGHWLVEFAYELPNGIHFRSVEWQDVAWNQVQYILNACAGTLESLIIMPRRAGNTQLEYLEYTENTALPQLTFRMPFPLEPALSFEMTLGALSTITSPIFSEFVFELGRLPSWERWGHWDEINKLFEERFAERSESRLVFRTGKMYDRETFQIHAKKSFPLLERRGCIRLETSYSLDQHWR